MKVLNVWKTWWRPAQRSMQFAPLMTTTLRDVRCVFSATEAGMAYRSIAAMLLIALFALPALGAQKTVLYEHFTASW